MPARDTPATTFNLPEGFHIPPGWAAGTIGPENQPYLVPYQLLPALEQMFDVKRAKEMPEVANASAKVTIAFNIHNFNNYLSYQPHFVQPYNHVVVGDVKVQVPANPVSISPKQCL